jgi:hypothetical protein
MFMKWGENGKESCVQSHPGEGAGWYPVVPAKKESYNPVTQQIAYEKVDGVIMEKVVGNPAPVYWQGRIEDYPGIADQLDAIWKGGEAMENMRKTVMAVKAKWPKPE